jgi:hypothetical protein
VSARIDSLPGVPGIISAEQVAISAQHIAQLQRASGQIPWWPGGHCDAWNHVEAAMALTASGLFDEARAAFRWLASSQLGDGSWFNYYVGDCVKDARLDTNVCAYVATGLYHYLLITGDGAFADEMWPVIEAGIEFVLRWQLADGTIRWSLDAAGRPEGYALLTGSSSIFHALRCAVALGEELGRIRPEWELAAGRLGHAIAHHRGAFAPKNEYAMDWYYPVLAGALSGPAAERRLADGWETYVMDGHGVRCVSTNDWVTAAETAECVIALDAVGWSDRALELFELAQRHRRADGSYWTGYAYPECITFPAQETTSYTAAAIILAVDALSSHTPAAGLFRHEKLPAVVDLAEPGCPLGLSSECERL